ncbi:MAG: DNA polymerase [bacterium]|nr:DNA polymerase [bacterium]
MKTIVLVDGNALLHRAYHALPPLSTSAGELINAVYGFTSTLLTVLKELHPEYVAVCWDRKAPTFRHLEYVGYKANRKEMDEGLASQYERVFQVLSSLNMPSFGLDGYEADDLIGTLKTKASKKKLKVIIVTGDRDALQLLDAQTTVYIPGRKFSEAEIIDEQKFKEKYGFEPSTLIDYKALAGDASDNIPGVFGIGEKTATGLLQQFGSVEQLYKHLVDVPQKVRAKLAEGYQDAVLSKKLATIVTDVPLELDVDACVVNNFDRKKAEKVFLELEFKSLISRLPGSTASVESVPNHGMLDTTQPPAILNLDRQLVPILLVMSKNGVLVDQKELGRLGKELHRKIDALEKEIFHAIGHEFNINSPKQLSTVLFDELGLTVLKKTKTGRSTDESVLQELSASNPAIPLILQYRELFKMKSTYVEAWPRFIGEDGRIHSTFNLGGAVTGRFSSMNPNLQNIPIKGEWGEKIRRVIIAPKRHVLLSADYSQIDLRVMAHVSEDPGLKQAFEEKQDIHTATASKMFRKKVAEITADERRQAKAVVFGLMYGMGPRSLSKTLGVSFEEAQLFIARYFEEFPKVRAFMDRTIQEASDLGFALTLLGRRRALPELHAQNQRIRAAGERMALNFPIQGGSADIINTAMVAIGAQGKRYWMILQIHDELLFEVEEVGVSEVASMVKTKMEGAIKLSVPLVVEVKTGKNWGEMEILDLS